jgi:hypothetical protein
MSAQVWLGGEPLPAQFEVWRQTWIGKHAGWKHMLWTEEDVEDFPFLRRCGSRGWGETLYSKIGKSSATPIARALR